MALGGFLLVLVYGYAARLPPVWKETAVPGQPASVQPTPTPQ
jgi:hypothetical protein